MTLIPTRDGVPLTEVKDRPDLPQYKLGPFCFVPGCGEFREQGDGHHVWRRSNQTKSWWVELPDGLLVPNRVGLCPQHHRDVTGDIGGHVAVIQVDMLGRLIWRSGGAGEPVHLEFGHDPFAALDELPLEVLSQLTVDGREVPHEQVVAEKHEHEAVQPGQKCPTCKRRVNHPKKKDSPVSKVTSMRMPLEAAETFEETLEACAEHAGVKSSEPYWKHKVITLALAYLLQQDTRALRSELQGRGG